MSSIDGNNQPVTDNTSDNTNPCDDPTRPLCRQYVNHGECRKRKRCDFYHPEIITPVITKQTKRKLKHCYCGAPQRCIVRTNRSDPTKGDVNFFVVCSRTGRSMKRCM